jgi:hypothetical protein
VTFPELTAPLLAAGAAHLALWTVGAWARDRLVSGPLEHDDRQQRAFQSAMLGFAILGTAAFALGAARLLFTPLVAAVTLVLAAVGMVRLARARRAPMRAPALTDVPMLAAVSFVLANLPRTLIPVLEHDESVYHLFLPKAYLAAHALAPMSWSLFANMPHLVDLSFVFPMALGGFTAAKVFVFGFVLWTLVGLAPFGRAVLGPFGPGVLALLYLSGRVVQWHLGLAYVEPVIGALLLCALQCLWGYWENGQGSLLRILAVVAGAACASKYTVWPHTLLLFAIVAVIRGEGGRRIGLGALTLLAGLCALCVAPWLVKSALVTGNPIYPNAYSWLGGTDWSSIQDAQLQHHLGYGRGADTDVAAYLQLPLRLVAEPYTGSLGSASFSGSVMVLLLASMAFPWRRAEFKTVLRILTLAGFVLWCLGPKQGRFLVAWLPVMIVTAGIALAPMRRSRWALGSVAAGIAIVAFLQMAAQPYPAEPLMEAFTDSRDELLSKNLSWDLTAFLNRVVPQNGRVLSFWYDWMYFLDRPFVADSAWGAPTVLARLREAGDAHVFAVKLAAEGFTHVVVNPVLCKMYMSNGFHSLDEQVYPRAQLEADAALLDRFIRTELDEVPSTEGWAVFRLRRATEPASR